MYLAYDSLELRELCEREDLAVARWGQHISRKLFSRVVDIHASHRVSDLPAGSPQIILYGLEEQLRISLGGNIFMFLVPLPIPPPLNKNGEVIWERISRLKVSRIGELYD